MCPAFFSMGLANPVLQATFKHLIETKMWSVCHLLELSAAEAAYARSARDFLSFKGSPANIHILFLLLKHLFKNICSVMLIIPHFPKLTTLKNNIFRNRTLKIFWDSFSLNLFFFKQLSIRESQTDAHTPSISWENAEPVDRYSNKSSFK